MCKTNKLNKNDILISILEALANWPGKQINWRKKDISSVVETYTKVRAVLSFCKIRASFLTFSPLLDGKVSVCGSHKKQTFLSSLIWFQTVEAHLSRNFPSSLLFCHLLSLETNKNLKCKIFQFYHFSIILIYFFQ